MLQDMLVVETAAVLAGPAVGMFFAELGAHVVKVENKRAGGDITRKWKLPGEDRKATVSAYFSSVNWGKEHRYLDLTVPEERAAFDELIVRADVLVTNHLADDTDKLGLSPERLRGLNPKLVHGHIRGYAGDPARPAFDVVLQAETGYLSMTGTDADHLAKLPIAMIDVLAAHQMKEGLLLALLQRERTGKGAYVEVTLEEAALSGLINQACNWLMARHAARPIGTLHPNIAPYGEVFTCGDGERLVLAIGTNDQFKQLCRSLDLVHLTHDHHFSDNVKRVANRNVLAQLLAPALRGKPRDAWLEAFTTAQVPAGAVNGIEHALASPTAQAMTLEELIDGTRTLRLRGNAFRITSY